MGPNHSLNVTFPTQSSGGGGQNKFNMLEILRTKGEDLFTG